MVKITPIKMEKAYQGLLNTFVKKNSDYGNSFEESLNNYGVIAGVVRISDKFSRLNTLLRNPNGQKVSDESIQDTLLDMANYCTMLSVYLDNDRDLYLMALLDNAIYNIVNIQNKLRKSKIKFNIIHIESDEHSGQTLTKYDHKDLYIEDDVTGARYRFSIYIVHDDDIYRDIFYEVEGIDNKQFYSPDEKLKAKLYSYINYNKKEKK